MLQYIILFISFLLLFQSNVFSQSVLKNGTWAKLSVEKTGIYQITYNDLLSMGFTPPIHSVSLYTNASGELPLLNSTAPPATLQQIPTFSQKSGSAYSGNDYVLFYGESAHTWYFDTVQQMFFPHTHSYSDKNYYFITVNTSSEKNIITENNITDNHTNSFSTFTERDYYKKNETLVIGSGRTWFEFFADKTLSFSTSGIVTSQDASFYVRLAGRDPSESKIAVSINGSPLPTIQITGTTSENPFARIATEKYSFTPQSGTNTIRFRALNTGINSKAYIDFVSLQYTRNLQVSSEQLAFRNINTISPSAIAKYEISSSTQLQVWNVTNPISPTRIPTNFSNGKTDFKTHHASIKEYIAFSNSFLKPVFVSRVLNQDLLSNTNFEMIIVASEEFHPLALELANVQKEQYGIRSRIVTQQQIFNEFSGGKADVAAIRNYARYVYLQNNGQLQYLLLFGDGSTDNRNFDASGTMILTYQSKESLSTYYSIVSDDFFGLLQANTGINSSDRFVGELSIAVGRFPVSTIQQAEIITRKNINYIKNPNYRGAWQNNLCFLADDADQNELFHMGDADKLTKNIGDNHPEFTFTKIYLDAYKQVVTGALQRYPDAEIAIENAVKKGCLVLNYTGHGNTTRLAAEQVLTEHTLQSWLNKEKLPLFITASCNVGRYDASYETLGEKLLLQEDGGAIALLSTTRIVFAFSNYILNNNIYKHLFTRDSITGQPISIGKAFMLAKAETPNDFNQNKRSFTILGNPALRIAMPEYKIYLDSINGSHISVFNDTLKAKSIVTISGYVQDVFGTPKNNYSGTLVYEVFDKEQTIKSLGNDGYAPFTFNAYTNILFRGKADINNGRFSTQFIIPKDIYYYEGSGKISLYCTDSVTDGFGIANNIPIFGTNLSAPSDNEGPKIQIFMNDTLFSSGQATHENPRLFVRISDPSGINISSSAIGHDITVILDNGKTDQVLTLNDFYIADNNTFASGSLEFPFTHLPPGNYTLTVRAWDTYNNFSEEVLYFKVISQEHISITSLYNYPNPFFNETTFRFSHNQADKEISILIRIYTMQGNLIKTLQKETFASGFTDESLYWDGYTDYGNQIPKGIYPYTLTITTEDGVTAISSQKIIVLQ